jgi:CheY-like chemotaxis protein
MDAVAFIETLRGDPALAHLPVIVTGAADDVARIEACLASGADDYLPAT